MAKRVSASEKYFPLKMTRANLDQLPEFALPPGFALRWYQPGDEAHWLRIHLAADQFNEITAKLFRMQFAVGKTRGLHPDSAQEPRNGRKSAPQELGDRQSYLVAPTGKVIGTGTAWFNDSFEDARWGRVHWMAILPEFQGRGLGKALLCVICRRLRELRHERAYLTTSAARVPAIALYLKFGFEPMIRSADDAVVWQSVLSRVKRQGR